MFRPTTLEEVRAAVRAAARILPRGGGTKPALSTPTDDVTPLDLAGLSGVLEYNPGEFTFTALAGTRLAEVQALLDSHGQHLPCDLPLAGQGATLGGAVAAGLSGPGRYRYGGVRDFILGVRLVDGNGDLVRGGGKVVKNAAGFDLPKLMVGSLGQFGVLVEVTFKVFPKSPAHTAIRRPYPKVAEAVQALYRLYTARLDVEALDLAPNADGSADVWVRLGGLPEALPARAERLRSWLGGGEALSGDGESALWQLARDFAWVPAGWTLVKAPLTPKRIVEVEALRAATLRRYSSCGNVAWIATPDSPQSLDEALSALGLPGLVVFGPPGRARIGARIGEAFERRVKAVFDPQQKFSVP